MELTCKHGWPTLQTAGCLPIPSHTCESNRHKPDARLLLLQVYNLTTYPHLVGFLDCLGVDSEPSDMSFSLSMDGGKLEWGSAHELDSIFAQRKNLVSPSFLGMVRDVIRFGKEAPKVGVCGRG